MRSRLITSIRRRLKMPFYAVAKGRNPGIYYTWEECKTQTHQFSRPVFKKFDTEWEAEDFLRENSDSHFTGYAVASSSSYADSPGRGYNRGSSRYDMGNEGFMVDDEGYVEVYTDGACSMNGQRAAKAGIGVWFGENHPLNVSRPVSGRVTNNSAEIEAVTEAARIAKRAGIRNLKIITDSQFLISCIKDWIPKWKRNGWRTADNQPVINKKELLEMERALEQLNVKWLHVNGHAGIYGNEMADKLARDGCAAYGSSRSRYAN